MEIVFIESSNISKVMLDRRYEDSEKRSLMNKKKQKNEKDEEDMRGGKGVGERTSGNRPGQHSRNDFVLRACLIMNPHPGEAPPLFAQRTTTSSSSSSRGSSRRGGRVHGTARVKSCVAGS